MHRIDGPARWVEFNGSNRWMTTMNRNPRTETNEPKSRNQASDLHQQIEAMSRINGSIP